MMKFKNFILECITITAMATVAWTPFAVDVWPHKSLVAFLISAVWLAVFFKANTPYKSKGTRFYLPED